MVAALAEPTAAKQHLLGPLDDPGFTFSATGLVIDPSVTYEQWEKYGRKLQLADKGIQWALGDWVIFGEGKFNERAAQAVEFAKRKVKTLQNYATVAGAIPKSRRRDSDSVDFTTYSEVASLPADEQEVILARAADDPEYSTRDARRDARRVKRKLKLIPDEVDLLHSPEIQDYLDGYVEGLKLMDAAVPTNAMFLHGMIQAHIGQAQWQKERTVESDCAAILDTFEEAYTQTDQDIYTHLTSSGHFISDPDLDDRLDLMVNNHQLKRVKTGGRQETRRGDMVDLYMLYDAPTGDAASVLKGSSVYDMGERE